MGSGAALHSQICYDYKQSHSTWNKLNIQIAPHPFRSGFAAKYILSPNLINKKKCSRFQNYKDLLKMKTQGNLERTANFHFCIGKLWLAALIAYMSSQVSLAAD